MRAEDVCSPHFLVCTAKYVITSDSFHLQTFPISRRGSTLSTKILKVSDDPHDLIQSPHLAPDPLFSAPPLL